MKNNIAVKLNKDVLPFIEREEILLSGICPYILPINKLKTDEGEFFVYSTENYIPLSELENLRALEGIKILENMIDMVASLEDYLLNLEGSIISVDNIFVSENLNDMKIAYIPIKSEESIKEILKSFIHQLKRITTESGKNYMEKILIELEKRKYNRRLLKNYILILKQEINLYEVK